MGLPRLNLRADAFECSVDLGDGLRGGAAMLAGALAGAALVLYARIFYPLRSPLIVTATVAAMAAILGKPEPAWVHAES